MPGDDINITSLASDVDAVGSLATASERTSSLDQASTWCSCYGKRILDLILGSLLTIAFCPLMLIVAVLIKSASPGPILFRQKRIGREGIPFELLKFRTMDHRRHTAGIRITRRGDPRVTRIGIFLRKWKLDELPQLFNVLRGEMSLVGPRPDLPEYLQTLSVQQLKVLTLSPGITGTASLEFRNEEFLLTEVAPEQVERFYVNTLLPWKIELELAYAREASLLGDIAILLRTATAVFH